jgi:hypothetical protein
VAGGKDNGSSRPGSGTDATGDRKKGDDDTPRETPTAKVSEGRLPAAPPVGRAPGAKASNGNLGDAGVRPPPDEAVRIDLPAAARDKPSPLREARTSPDSRAAGLQRDLGPDDTWRPPARVADVLPPRAEGRVYVRTFEARGVLGAVLVLLGFLVVLGLVVALFTIAVGVGAAIAAGGALAAAFGLGAARVRKALRAQRGQLEQPDDNRRPK